MDRPTLRFLGHSTVRIELAGKVLLTDPVLTSRVGPLTRTGPSPDRCAWDDVDLVLVSHLHGDHLHLPSLRLLGRDVLILVPPGVGTWLRRRGFRRVEELAIGASVTHGPVRITGVHADHSGHRWGPRLTHGPEAPAMGHLLETGESRLYVSGDTDLFTGMRALAPLDVALLPVWGWGPNLGPGHLDPDRAAKAVELLRPRVAVPVHWGTLALAGLARSRSRWGARMRRLLVEPPQRFAAAVAAAGLPTRVVIARPGTDVGLDHPGRRNTGQA